MIDDEALERATELFKALSSSSRLKIVQLLSLEPLRVTEIVEATSLSQPLVSQHLKNLRAAGVVAVTRQGTTAIYGLLDEHVVHIVNDALHHAGESHDQHNQGEKNDH